MSIDQRIENRVTVGVVGLEIDGVCSTGRVHDISASGARIEDTPLKPPIGAPVQITFVLSLDRPGFEVLGEVARLTETGGFAIAFQAVDPQLRTILIELAEQARRLPDYRHA